MYLIWQKSLFIITGGLGKFDVWSLHSHFDVLVAENQFYHLFFVQPILSLDINNLYNENQGEATPSLIYNCGEGEDLSREGKSLTKVCCSLHLSAPRLFLILLCLIEVWWSNCWENKVNMLCPAVTVTELNSILCFYRLIGNLSWED